MRDKIELNGIVLSSMPVGDYDKRLVLLTKERGKITAFARGARKQSSPYLGLSEPFNFGTFFVVEGFDAYRLVGGSVKEHFSDVKNDIEGICYGTYFCDVMEYLSVDGIGDVNMLNLLYLSLKALTKTGIPNALVRRVFELRILAYDGETMAAFSCIKCGRKQLNGFYLPGDGLVCAECASKLPGVVMLSESAIYMIQYVLSCTLDKLYTFQLSDTVFREVDGVVDAYFTRHVNGRFNSLEILASLS